MKGHMLGYLFMISPAFGDWDIKDHMRTLFGKFEPDALRLCQEGYFIMVISFQAQKPFQAGRPELIAGNLKKYAVPSIGSYKSLGAYI